ncbi:MAG TPA: ATP-binding protein [Opitutaceae bacterium]|nr:ATP-binding protein [Opitutaceae bacterium]
MLERFRQSLAIRLAVVYALVFAAGASALFGVLYWVLAHSLEARERAAVEVRAENLARAYELGGAPSVRERLDADTSPDVRSLFVRLLGANGTTLFATVPSDWVDPQVERRLVPDGWGGWSTQEIHSVRVPRDAARDFAVASRVLSDGRLIQVARSTDSRAVLLAPLRTAFAGVGAVALLLSLTAGTFLAWRATRPLREVAETARRILDEHDLSARVRAPGGSGELATLARQLNTLLDKNAAHVRVLRETLDDLAHDLRTPLTRLRGTAELALRDGGNPAEARTALADCVDETDRVLHLLEVLLDVSAAEAGALALRRERVDLRALATRAADLYREVAEQKGIGIALELPARAEMDGDPVRLGQALSNLVDNALKYTPEGGRVALAVAADPSAVTVTVSDNGPGVPAAERDAVWRRLYRGDASRSQRGWGLGLTLVRAVAEAHGGSASVSDAPGGGARFQMRFPAA